MLRKDAGRSSHVTQVAPRVRSMLLIVAPIGRSGRGVDTVCEVGQLRAHIALEQPRKGSFVKMVEFIRFPLTTAFSGPRRKRQPAIRS